MTMKLFTKLKKVVTFVLVQILPGLTLPQLGSKFQPLKQIQRLKKKKLLLV